MRKDDNKSTMLEQIVKELSVKYRLNPREEELLKVFIEGKSYLEISKELYITRPAITYHAQNLFKKMDIENRHHLIMRIIDWMEDRTTLHSEGESMFRL